MSTILDALRKVERDRDPSADPVLEATTVSSQVRRRRSLPWGAILACAVVGFGGGAALSWWLPSEPAVEVAKLPEPPPPPDIAVPRAPLRAKPVAPSAPAADSGVVVSPPIAAPPAAIEAAPAAVAQKAAEPSVPVQDAARPDGGKVVAALDPKATALEPSPFGPARDTSAPAPSEPAKAAGAVEAPSRPPRAEVREPQDLAAVAPLAPAVPEEPAVDESEGEAEPEPETPAETVVDTGRSPPGAPKVALSFLQWSVEPARRFAFISIDGAPSQRVHEGEVAAGLTVAAITPNGVRFKREGTIFVIRPRH